jgi:hypothetical protein
LATVEFATAVWFWVHCRPPAEAQAQTEERGTRFSRLGPPKAEEPSFDILENPELLWVDVPLDPSHQEASGGGENDVT